MLKFKRKFRRLKVKQRGHANDRIVCQDVKWLVGFESAKKRVFYTVIESILICGWEIWTLVYKLKRGKKIKYKHGFLGKRSKDCTKEMVIRKGMGVTQTVLGRRENNAEMVRTLSTH